MARIAKDGVVVLSKADLSGKADLSKVEAVCKAAEARRKDEEQAWADLVEECGSARAARHECLVITD